MHAGVARPTVRSAAGVGAGVDVAGRIEPNHQFGRALWMVGLVCVGRPPAVIAGAAVAETVCIGAATAIYAIGTQVLTERKPRRQSVIRRGL